MRGIRTFVTAGLLAIGLAGGLAGTATAQRYDRDRGDRGGGWDNVRLEGLSVDQAKYQLRSSGFAPARSIRLDGRQWDLWSSGRSCMGFASYNGRVTNSERFSDGDCGGYGDGGGWNDRDRNDRGGWNNGRGNRGGRVDSRELVGLSVDDGKRALSWSGFQPAVGTTIRGQRWDLWRSGGSCMGFTSYHGRITDAQRFPEDRCWR